MLELLTSALYSTQNVQCSHCKKYRDYLTLSRICSGTIVSFSKAGAYIKLTFFLQDANKAIDSTPPRQLSYDLIVGVADVISGFEQMCTSRKEGIHYHGLRPRLASGIQTGGIR